MGQTFNIPGQTILANVEKDSPSQTLAADTTSVFCRLTGTTAWNTTAGNILQWGIQCDSGDGNGFAYIVSAGGIAFGSQSVHNSGLPALQLTGDKLVAAAGKPLRLAILTDANIVLGCQIITSP